jgi:general secretion pathway protein F
MPTFRYTAIDAAGKVVHGSLDAASAATVADRLHGQGRLLLRADQVGGRGALSDLLHAELGFDRGLPKAQVAQFTRELAVMLGAGQDIDHALRFLVESAEDKRVRRVIEALRNQVRGGKSLAAALSDHPKIFPRIYVSLVRAGEAGGNLAESLDNLAGLFEREIKLAGTVQSAMIYPALLFVLAVSTIALLLTYVLPQFQPIFDQAGARLPRATRILIGVGDFVRADGLFMLVFLLFLGFLAYRSMKDPGVRQALEKFALRLPIVSPLIRRSQAARFTRTLGTLLANGVGMVSAMSISRGVLGNLVAARVVERAGIEVKAGRKLGAALAAGKFFPPQTIQLIEVGEETGRLSEMALRAADIHDEQVGQSVQRLVALLVPAVTILMGLAVAGIVASLLLAMLSLNDLPL